ncbi:metallophosphoesterase family protein [Clostridium sp. D2Q-14]|nr:metallophosphoesterase [Anaeromonas gelatinilytica]MBS4535988.1 metallophosphoesterase family protein [Anaeromonas gelatinilytica]
MKILYFTDTHIRGTTPKNRKDNILETLERKFNEIVNIINLKNIDFVLHGGDIFDRPDISPSVVRKFAMILNNIKVPIYAIAGNHDLYGHNPNTLHRTMLGLFDGIELLKLINEKEKIILEKDDIKVQLTGAPYKYGIDSDRNKASYIINEKDENVNYAIHLVHGMLLDKPFIKGIPYTLIDDILETKADITLCGHYHSGFGIKEFNNKFFINPGSLIRITNSLKEIKRIPKVLIINIQKDIKLDFYYLESAKNGEEILDRSVIEKNMFKNEKMIYFKQSVEASQDFNKLDINHVLNDLSIADNIDKKVKSEAIKRIEEAQIEIGKED